MYIRCTSRPQKILTKKGKVSVARSCLGSYEVAEYDWLLSLTGPCGQMEEMDKKEVTSLRSESDQINSSI